MAAAAASRSAVPAPAAPRAISLSTTSSPVWSCSRWWTCSTASQRPVPGSAATFARTSGACRRSIRDPAAASSRASAGSRVRQVPRPVAKRELGDREPRPSARPPAPARAARPRPPTCPVDVVADPTTCCNAPRKLSSRALAPANRQDHVRLQVHVSCRRLSPPSGGGRTCPPLQRGQRADHQRCSPPRRRTSATTRASCAWRLARSAATLSWRDHGRDAGRGSGSAGLRRLTPAARLGRQPGRGRRLEQDPDRDPRLTPVPAAAAPASDREQRVPAEREEVVLRLPDLTPCPRTSANAPHTTPLPAPSRAPGPRPRHGGMHQGTCWQRAGPCESSFPFGHRQRQRTPSTTTADGTMCSGSRIGRDAHRTSAASPSPVRAGTGNQVRRRAAGAAGHVLADGLPRPGLPRRQRASTASTLARLDPEAADLHLVVGPARRTRAAPSPASPSPFTVHRATVTGPVHPRSGGPNGHATNRSAVSPARPR